MINNLPYPLRILGNTLHLPSTAESAPKPRLNFSSLQSFLAAGTHNFSLSLPQAPSHQCHESLPHTHAVPRTMPHLQGSKFGGLSIPTTRCAPLTAPLSCLRKESMRGLPVKVPRASGRNLASEIQRRVTFLRGGVHVFSLWKSRCGDCLSADEILVQFVARCSSSDVIRFRLLWWDGGFFSFVR